MTKHNIKTKRRKKRKRETPMQKFWTALGELAKEIERDEFERPKK